MSRPQAGTWLHEHFRVSVCPTATFKDSLDISGGVQIPVTLRSTPVQPTSVRKREAMIDPTADTAQLGTGKDAYPPQSSAVSRAFVFELAAKPAHRGIMPGLYMTAQRDFGQRGDILILDTEVVVFCNQSRSQLAQKIAAFARHFSVNLREARQHFGIDAFVSHNLQNP